MPKQQPADDAPVESDGAPKRSRWKIIVPAVVVAMALLTGGALATGVLDAGAAEGVDGEAVDPTPTPTELGELVQLESVTLNLAGGRFLKLGLALELAPGAVPPATAPVYDEVIDLFGDHTFEALSDTTVREMTKADLLGRLAGTYGETFVAAYYTEFVMQ